MSKNDSSPPADSREPTPGELLCCDADTLQEFMRRLSAIKAFDVENVDGAVESMNTVCNRIRQAAAKLREYERRIEAGEELVKAAFKGDHFRSKNDIPMECVPRIRKALARWREAKGE